jgi:spermidine synthase
VLRRRAGVLELISNGMFLMDSAGGESERAMARLALDGAPAGACVLVGGLGFGFTLAAVLEHDVGAVVVVERETELIAWNRRWCPPCAKALDDPRVTVVVDDVSHYLAGLDARFDVLLLDVDNGPDWTVTADNAGLYGARGIATMRRVLRPGGRLAVWSAAASDAFEDRLRQAFGSVSKHDIPVARGEPDVIFLAF